MLAPKLCMLNFLGFAFQSEALLWSAWSHRWKWWCWGRICPTAPWSAPHPRSAGTGDPWTPHTAAGTRCWSLHECWGNASAYSSESAGKTRTKHDSHEPVRVVTGMCFDDDRELEVLFHLRMRKRRLGQINLRLLVLTQPSTQTHKAREEKTAREWAIIEHFCGNITAIMKHYHGNHNICQHVTAPAVRMIKPMNFSEISGDIFYL